MGRDKNFFSGTGENHFFLDDELSLRYLLLDDIRYYFRKRE